MVETLSVSDLSEFTTALDGADDVELDTEGMVELWDIWSARADDGHDQYLVVVPEWFAGQEFGKRRPFFFGSSEFDDPGKGAMLFSDVQMIDISIVENGAFDRVSMDHTLELLDISEEDDYIDEAGLIWIPRSLMTVFERA
jgi:hypothetical protein